MDEPFPPEFGQPEFLGKIPLFAELQRLLAWSGGPVHWDLARQLAIATAASAEGAGATAADAAEVADAFRLASMLIADATGLEPPIEPPIVYGPVGWAEAAPEFLASLLEPVAQRTGGQITGAMPLPDAIPKEVIEEALAQAAPLLFGAQAGQVLGRAATVITGTHDLGLLLERDVPDLVPVTIGRIVRTHGLDERAALQAAAIASVAATTVGASATLRARFLSAVLEVIAALDVDLTGLRIQLEGLTDPFSEPVALDLEPGPQAIAARAQAEAVCALYLAAADRVADAAAARAGITIAFGPLRAPRFTDEVTALRGTLGLPANDPSIANGFVEAVVVEGGFELLTVALDDPMLTPSRADLGDPAAWISRVR